jgi:hypothetical protein
MEKANITDDGQALAFATLLHLLRVVDRSFLR